jgi:hypothetical protein
MKYDTQKQGKMKLMVIAGLMSRKGDKSVGVKISQDLKTK